MDSYDKVFLGLILLGLLGLGGVGFHNIDSRLVVIEAKLEINK